jgi:hypothetical protein
MKSRRLGCLSATGLLAAALTLLLVLGVFLLRGGRMFSPGPLNAQASGVELGGAASHADTGGDCATCHTAPWDRTTMAQRCLDCHAAIVTDLADPTSLHGALQAQGADMDCRQCHTEHRGPAAGLTLAEMDDFPHDMTGFSLTGHGLRADGSPFNCQDCHAESLARFDVMTCDACHRQDDSAFMQAHRDDFGSACLDCHDGIDSYSRANFDHSRLAFALTGRHVEVACTGCHAGARSIVDLQATPTDCYACHARDDAHDGQLGQDCAACHNTTDWQQATFDHSLTAFPLTGEHASVECSECHLDRVFRGTPTTCIACHVEDDAHDGQFGRDCAACHVTSDWRDVTFDHNLTAFPLTGQHTTVECADCHVNQVFRGTPTACVACHVDPVFHAGVFGVTCTDCHTTTAWQPARFDRIHTFPFDHGEAGVNACRTCHVVQVQDYTCYTCHDPGEIEEEHVDEGIFDFRDCTSCHPTGTEDEAKDRQRGG